MAIVDHVKAARKTQQPKGFGPAAVFTGAVFAALIGLLAASTAMPRDFALAAASTVFFAFAVLAALIAWTTKPKAESALNYWDVAGALTLIGICAATFLDSDAIIKFIEGRPVAG